MMNLKEFEGCQTAARPLQQDDANVSTAVQVLRSVSGHCNGASSGLADAHCVPHSLVRIHAQNASASGVCQVRRGAWHVLSVCGVKLAALTACVRFATRFSVRLTGPWKG